eukprot:6308407-Pyramimonas_sp.AAC.1
MRTRAPLRQIELHKWAIREVAADLRDRLFHKAPEANATLLLLARQISRVVWRNDHVLARKLMTNHAAAYDFLEIKNNR